MVKTKQTARRGSSSHRPGGMATARFTGAEEDEPQFADAPGEETEDSQEWPEYAEEETGASKSTGKAGENPSRQKEDQRYLLKKIHHHPQTPPLALARIPPLVLVRTPLIPHQQFPPRIPLKPRQRR